MTWKEFGTLPLPIALSLVRMDVEEKEWARGFPFWKAGLTLDSTVGSVS